MRSVAPDRPVVRTRSRFARYALAAAIGLLALTAGACSQPGRPLPVLRERVTLRHLVAMLDGVPYNVMDSLWNAGHFRGFLPPSRLVSTFPSITGVAFRDIWREAPTPGYEDRYYDRDRSRMAGGLLEHVFAGDDDRSFHRHIDVMADGVTAGLAYIVPLTTARAELANVRRALAERLTTDTTLVVYIVSTDALAHMSPREDLIAYLLGIESLLDEVQQVAGPDLEITMFSDHGNDRIPTERVEIESALERAGFHAARRVESPTDVVLPRFGLVGSAFLYGAPESLEALASAVHNVPGVDFVTWRNPSTGIHVMGPGGHAIIENDGQRYRYRALSGDPLLLTPVIRDMQRQGIADASGFAPDTAWLVATVSGPFVDPLRRITLGLRSVDNPADVIVSLAPGYHFGDQTADRVVGMAGTHGSLRTTSSLAFAMSTRWRIPDPVRSDALATWVPLPRHESTASGQTGNASHDRK